MSDNKNFAALLDDSTVKLPKVGDLITGKVLSLGRNELRLDVGGIMTGVVRGPQLYNESSEYRNLKLGDEIEATVIELENENGDLELSFRFVGHTRAWGHLEELRRANTIIKSRVKEANKGGLLVDIEGTDGFLPVSQLNPEHYPRVTGGDKNKILEKLREYVGQELAVRVLDVNEKEDKLIVSEKTVWEDSQKTVSSNFQVGQIVEGEVSAITSFGAFVKFAGAEGLAHISELAWQRIDHPKDVVAIGQQVKAEIIQVEGAKIFLSLKRLVPDPWQTIGDKYKMNQIVSGKILKVNPFGLFVELDPEIHGLAHVSELSNEPITDINLLFKPGETRDFEIVSVEPSEHRLGLRVPGVTPKADVPKKEEQPEETK